MKDKHRKEEARLRAQAYAPAPTDSRLLYGVVSASLMLVILFVAGGFYEVDPLQYPAALLGLVVLALALGLVVRRLQLRRHRKAQRVEYDNGRDEP